MALSNLTKVQTVGIGSNIEVVGVITTGQFKSGTSNLHSTGVELTNLNVSGIATIGGNLSVGGVLTYEDVTNIDSIGIITARSTVSIADSIVHTGDTNTSIRFPAADTVSVETAGSERLRITSDGKVGINRTSPARHLHAYAAGAGFVAKFEGAFSYSAVEFADSGTTNAPYIGSKNDHFTIATGGNNERLRIDSSGRFMINMDTSITGGKFQVNNQYNTFFAATNDANPCVLQLQKTRSTSPGSYTIVQDGDKLGELQFKGSNGSAAVIGANIQAVVNGTPGSGNDLPTDLVFRLMPDGVGSTLERLRITSTGILVTGGGTAPSSTDVGSIFMPGGGDLGWLTSSGSITFNAYYNGGWKYVTTGTSHILWASSEGFNFSTASSGSADGTISYSRAMKIFTNNRVSIGDGNSGSPLGALHINTKSTMGTDTALWIGDNANKRYMAINQVSNSEMFSEMKLQYNDNGTRSVLKLSNPYAPAGYGTAILWQGYNDGQQGMILCQSEGANNAAATMYLNSSSGTFLQGNSSRHVTMPQQPAFLAYHYAHDINYGVGSTLPYPYTVFNTGNHYNTSNSTFTAPTAGRYLFSVNANGNYTSGASGIPRAYWKINGSNVGNAIHLRGSDATHDGLEQRSQTVIFNLSANDTVKVVVGQNQWDLFGANSFTGYLIG